MLLNEWDEISLQQPDELLELWREQRSYRVGKRLSIAALVLALIATAVDYRWSAWVVTATDLVLVIGCGLSLLWTRKQPRPYFCWWPLYVGFWISCIPSLVLTGGINSPFFGVDLALLVVASAIVQSRIPWWVFLGVATVHFPVFYFLERWVKLPHAPPPPELTIAVVALTLAALAVCVYELLRTESEISNAFARHYRALAQTRAELHKEEQANAAKTTFLANVSHELRTPLTSILGYSDLLMNTEVPAADRYSFLQTIFRNGLQLSHLVDDLLDLSKAEIGKIEIQKAPFNLMDMIGEVVQQARLQAQEKGLLLQIRELGPVPDQISSDALRMKQILVNVVGNAIKFTDQGSVWIEVGVQNDSSGPSLNVRVRDTGRGMSAREQEFLFKPFSQIDPSLSRRHGGTGLGLHLSRKLARMMGGDLVLEQSQLAQGSSFVLSLPQEPVDLPIVELGVGPTFGNLVGKNVLIIEDMIDTQRLLAAYLEGAGARVVVATDGFDGLKKALSRDFAAVVLDIQMPLMDGYETARGLRRQGLQVPVLALTAHALPEERELCLTAGCDAYLSKPVTRVEFLKSLDSLLSESRNKTSMPFAPLA